MRGEGRGRPSRRGDPVGAAAELPKEAPVLEGGHGALAEAADLGVGGVVAALPSLERSFSFRTSCADSAGQTWDCSCPGSLDSLPAGMLWGSRMPSMRAVLEARRKAAAVRVEE